MAAVRTKGSHVINAVKVLRRDKERARVLLPPNVHKYLEERILPSSWYPLDEHKQLLYAIAAQLGGASEATWIAMGRAVARMDLTGLYKRHLKVGDIEGSLRWMPAMWKNAYDQGELRVTVEGPGRASVTLLDFPGRDSEVCQICTGYMTELFLLAAGFEARLTQDRCRARQERQCCWTITWDWRSRD